jgi:hypothetical protein
MDMKEVATIQFLDAESNDEGVVVLRASCGLIAVALSLQKDGDLEVVLRLQDCQKLINELQRAVSIAEGG